MQQALNTIIMLMNTHITFMLTLYQQEQLACLAIVIFFREHICVRILKDFLPLAANKTMFWYFETQTSWKNLLGCQKLPCSKSHEKKCIISLAIRFYHQASMYTKKIGHCLYYFQYLWDSLYQQFDILHPMPDTGFCLFVLFAILLSRRNFVSLCGLSPTKFNI